MIKLYNGDCLKMMKWVPANNIDFIFTDLPYGSSSCAWDNIIPFNHMWKQIKRIRKDNSSIALFGMEPFSSTLRMSNIKEFKYDWFWEKERLTNVMQVKRRAGKTVENISIFYKKQCTYNPQFLKHNGPVVKNKIKKGSLGALIDNDSKKPVEYKDNGFRYPTQVLRFKRDILKLNLHPTQKPLLLCEFLIKTYTNEGDTVLDFTMGSNSTGVACKNLNRNFIGIEQDETYFDIAKERIC